MVKYKLNNIIRGTWTNLENNSGRTFKIFKHGFSKDEKTKLKLVVPKNQVEEPTQKQIEVPHPTFRIEENGKRMKTKK